MPNEILKISATEVVKSIREGLDDSALMSKYNLSKAQLDLLFKKLIENKSIAEEELTARTEYLAPKKEEGKNEPPIEGTAGANQGGGTAQENPGNAEGKKEREQPLYDVRREAAKMFKSWSDWPSSELADIVKGADVFVKRLRTEGARSVFSMNPDAPSMSSSEKKFILAVLAVLALIVFVPFWAAALSMVGVLVWMVGVLVWILIQFLSAAKRKVEIRPADVDRPNTTKAGAFGIEGGGTEIGEHDRKLVCPKCRREYEGSVKFCTIDGSELRKLLEKCPHCGNTLEGGSAFCGKCGKGVMDYSQEPPYYQQKFQLFEQNNGQYKWTWNWPGFLFSAFWYLYKGMWGKALIMFAVGIVLAIFLPKYTGFLIPIWAATWGNYDYYLFRKYGEQFWRFS
jgi:hypothetical protein